jgi:hypothetical protein
MLDRLDKQARLRTGCVVLLVCSLVGLSGCVHRRGDRDNNPPGPAGGPGTNWENPPGPAGGPGTSPDRRRWYRTPDGSWRDRDDNPPGPAGGPGTNWENPPGSYGGYGTSPDRR